MSAERQNSVPFYLERYPTTASLSPTQPDAFRAYGPQIVTIFDTETVSNPLVMSTPRFSSRPVVGVLLKK